MELGETLCIPNGTPLCETCPLADCCAGKQNGTAAELPVRLPKKEKRGEVLTVFLLSRDGRFAVRRRPEKGLLGGMWEFPNVPGKLSGAEAAETVRAWDLTPAAIQSGAPHTHVFTHIRWQMRCYVIHCGAEASANGHPAAAASANGRPAAAATSAAYEASADFHWATPEELTDTYALPTAFRVFFSEII
jgi:A/G-specific adenine glycosylase